MHKVLSKKGKLGLTRFTEQDNETWTSRAFYISEDLQKPHAKDIAKTRKQLNLMEEKAINKKKSIMRMVLHKGHYKYKDSDFQLVRDEAEVKAKKSENERKNRLSFFNMEMEAIREGDRI